MSRFHAFIAGAASSGALAMVVSLVGLAAGAWPRPHLVVVPAGVAAAAVAALLAGRPLDGLSFRLGAASVAPLALLSETVTSTPGLGAVQLVAIASALVVAGVGPGLLAPLTRPVAPWVVGLGFVAVVAVLIRVVVGGGELGHDEAAYALKGRAWIAGTPDTGWSLHRGVGQSVLAATVLAFNDSPAVLRAASVVLSAATLAAVWGLGRVMASRDVGLLAAGVFAVAPSFLRRGAEFLTDVPSTGLLLVVAILLWRWIHSVPARDSYLYGATVVAAIAVYVRYQSMLSLALLAAATAVVGWKRLHLSMAPIAKAAGLALVLLLPHFLHAVAATGRPWGIIAATARAGGRQYLGEGIVDYLRDFPDLLAGQLGAGAIVAAVVWAGWCLATGRDRERAVFLLLPALGQVVALGLVSHGEPRFVFFPVALFAVAGGIAAEGVKSRFPAGFYRAGVVALGVAMIASLGLHGDRADRNAEARAGSVEALVEAAAAVRAEAEGSCGIVTGSQPQLTWLSRCPTAPFDLRTVAISLQQPVDAFLILSEHGPRQPEGELRAAYLDLAAEEPVVAVEDGGSLGRVEVWDVED